MNFEGVIALLQSIKGFRVNDELPFNTVDYLAIDEAIEFLAAQHSVQSDGLKPCTECGALGYSHRPSCSKFGSYVVSTRR